MKATGEILLDGGAEVGIGESFAATSATGGALEQTFNNAGFEQVDRACELASAAFDFREGPLEQRAWLLQSVADQIFALGEQLIECCMRAIPSHVRLPQHLGRNDGVSPVPAACLLLEFSSGLASESATNQ